MQTDKNAAPTPQAVTGRATPQQVLQSIEDGINSGDIEALMTLYEPDAVFAAQPGTLVHGLQGIRDGLMAFIAMKGTITIALKHVLEGNGLALVIGTWTFTGTGPDGNPVTLSSQNADVLRRQPDGTWRFAIDNPWGTN